MSVIPFRCKFIQVLAGTLILATLQISAYAQGQGSAGQPFNNLQHQIDQLQAQIDALIVSSGVPLAMDVDCRSGETLAAAINSVAESAPLTITVYGTCNENLFITKSNLTLRGASQSDGVHGSYIGIYASRSASNVVVENMTLSGSFAAIACINAAAMQIRDVVIKDSARGILSFDGGSCRLDDSKVLGNIQGATVGRNATLTIRGVDFLGNNVGANVFSGGSLAFEASVATPNKRSLIKGIRRGVNVYNNGSLSLQDVSIEGHAETGVSVRYGGVIHSETNYSATIRNNGVGILVGELGILNVVHPNNFSIEDNAGYGVDCVPDLPLVIANRQLISFSGNSLGEFSHSCAD